MVRTRESLYRQGDSRGSKLWQIDCRWWQEADSPWQLLAVCYDLQAALASGNPETYLSKIPVHQDGSCNGLQHYAALGRDEPGGRAVNLLPVDKPQVTWTCCLLTFPPDVDPVQLPVAAYSVA